MPELNEELRRVLSDRDEDFRRWSDEHHRYEARLAELASKSMLSVDEEIEEKQLKKLKLALKDQMVARLRQQEAYAH
ncbi:MAG TPA: DUF465 domain-containing protein [Thermoanaerobaculia bacterium]|nr:DUF465 domain-containing protein [Thermoanaerobaculia bacterium]